MRATIEDIDVLGPYIFNFDPYQTHAYYQDDWEKLFKKIQDNYTVFQTMVRMARVNNEPPAVIDRLLWLIGSGKYVEENEKITRQKASFIQDICSLLYQI